MDKKTPDVPLAKPTDAHYYRFGLSGLSSGGKTCLLAALALPRVTRANGLTASPLPVSGKAAQHLKDGRKWLDEACTALRGEGVPPPNSIENIGQLTLRYKFTDGCQREVFVELVDYSGELLDSRLSQSELAGQLRRYLGEVDGFLFVAEYPKAGENAADLANYLQHLREALALLRHEVNGSGNAPSAPIALLVNKWDRSGLLSRTPSAYEEETRKLKAFLESEPLPPHAGLLADLTAASRGGCRAFPLSAFGEAIRVPSEKEGEFIEKPAQVTPELPSFGIEEPVLWLVEQRDRCDADALEVASRKRNLWINPWTSHRCRWKAKRLMTRMSAASPEITRVRRVHSRLNRRFGAHVLWLVLIYLVGDLSRDVMKFRHERAAMANPADKDGWANAEAWFTNYTESSPLRHVLHRRFILSNDAASEELLSARTARDQSAWKSVVACKDEAARDALAAEYLKAFPQGIHWPAALQIQTEAKTRQDRSQLRARIQALVSRLASLEKEVEQAEKSTPPDFKPVSDKLASLERDVQNVPGLEVADESLSKQRQDVVAGVGSLCAKIAGRLAAGKTRKDYFDLTERHEWEKAGRLLAGLPPAEFSDLRENFREKVMSQVEARAIYLLGNGAGWKESKDFIEGFRTAKLRPLLPESANELMDSLMTRIKQKGDRGLYESCSGLGGRARFTAYLEDAPLGSMNDVAKEWLHFLDLRENKNTYRVGVDKIKWNENARKADTFYDTENRIWISIGAATKKTTLWDNRIGEYVPNNREKFAVEVRDAIAGDQQAVSLQLWDIDSPDGDDSLGELELKSSIEGLQDLTINLKGAEFGPNTVTFWVEVFDNEHWTEFRRPALPPWTPPQ
jgi:hypothetical protein